MPASAMVDGEFVALLLTMTDPMAGPLAEGANRTLKDVDWAGLRIKPAALPPALKPAPETRTCEIVTAEFPALVSVMFCELLPGTVTLEQSKRIGRAELLVVRTE